GDHAEVPAATPEGPEELGVLVGRGVHDLPRRRDHVGADEVVAAEAGLAGQPAEPAAQGETGDAGVADEPARHGEAVLLAGGIELSPPRAAAARGSLGGRVDRDLVHRAEV